jgi:hypothetical protein
MTVSLGASHPADSARGAQPIARHPKKEATTIRLFQEEYFLNGQEMRKLAIALENFTAPNADCPAVMF